MKTIKRVCGLLITALLIVVGEPAGTFQMAVAGDKVVAGYIEKVTLGQKVLVFKAKLDTGARHSSLNATDIQMFERKGVSWVRFIVTDSKGKTMRMEKKAFRVAGIKTRDETLQERPVIMLLICLGPVQKEVEVNLVDRSFFNYQVLIGRSFLKGSFLVDSGAKFLNKLNACTERADE